MTEATHAAFALAVHRALPAGNRCWSPFSVAAALCRAAGVAGEDTGPAVADVLRADVDRTAKLLAVAADEPAVTSADTIWVDPAAPAAQHPDVRRLVLDEHAHVVINEVVRELTHGLVRQAVPPRAITPGTLAVLVNALHVKGAWAEDFPEEDTRPRKFRAPSGKRMVPTMRRTGASGYAARHGWQSVLIPCEEALDVVALLPDQPLATAELDGEALADLITGVRFTEVDLYLPKVDLEAGSALVEPLRALGAGPLFDSWLLVEQVLHQAKLTLDEHGVEGAAATTMIAAMGWHDPGEALVVRFDRPFLLAVRHRGTGLLLFLAEVTEP
ncbi:serpin family protein [Saccharothrix luteola]|uniref:serpin family protein n=1 Tax=Saccharothrix luteola TaxID=2893018 RepID=UPI001E33DCAD|nr:serpin family protein [Saccharothrix luteola]MCC8245239.1 serpin family protein [Saccharothrix luteola]